MIALKKEDLQDQAGMERAFRGYFKDVVKQCDGTFNAMLGMSLQDCDFAKRQVTLRMETRRWMANPSNVAHGGVTAAALDLTMGLLARYCTGGHMTPTVSMEVSYLRPIPLDSVLFVQARITRPGFTICYATGSAWLEGQENAPAATATGTYYVSKRPG